MQHDISGSEGGLDQVRNSQQLNIWSFKTPNFRYLKELNHRLRSEVRWW